MSCGKHHDKDCSEVLERVFFFIDNELPNADHSEIQQHLDECAPCLRKYDLERTVKMLVRRSCAERAQQTAMHVRSFAPAHGIPEDPVCGSGNLGVAHYLKKTNGLKRFGERYIARQGMQMKRDGRVHVRVDEDGVRIGGRAVTCIEGTLRI